MQPCDVSILVCTWNRADLLRQTLTSLAKIEAPPGISWEVVVVDNNSTDDTARTVESFAGRFPAPLRYLFESRQGRSCAMNTGIAATTSPILVFTDDDVHLTANWLSAAVTPLLNGSDIAYSGGPVQPIWEAPQPAWFAESGRILWGTLAILDYGAEPFVFEERRLVPLGVNFAVRRSLIERVGGFNPSLGRNAESALLGQELPEFFARTRAIGARGLYVPDMLVYHHVPARRLSSSYWRRWWYGKGMSRARVERLHPVTELGLDLRQVPTLFGMPRFLFGNALRDAIGWCRALLTGRVGRRVSHETQLCYFAGQIVERIRWRRHAAAPLARKQSIGVRA